jgi:hypothetical protein
MTSPAIIKSLVDSTPPTVDSTPPASGQQKPTPSQKNITSIALKVICIFGLAVSTAACIGGYLTAFPPAIISGVVVASVSLFFLVFASRGQSNVSKDSIPSRKGDLDPIYTLLHDIDSAEKSKTKYS